MKRVINFIIFLFFCLMIWAPFVNIENFLERNGHPAYGLAVFLLSMFSLLLFGDFYYRHYVIPNLPNPEKRKQEALKRAFDKLSNMSKEEFTKRLEEARDSDLADALRYAMGTDSSSYEELKTSYTHQNPKPTTARPFVGGDKELQTMEQFKKQSEETTRMFDEIHNLSEVERKLYDDYTVLHNGNKPGSVDCREALSYAKRIAGNLKNTSENYGSKNTKIARFPEKLEYNWSIFILNEETGEFRKMTEEEIAKIPRY